MGESVQDYRVLYGFVLFCVALSLAGSVFIMFSFAFFKKLRRRPFDLVFFMACADFFGGLGVLVSTIDNAAACDVGGVLQNFFPLASYMWTATIAQVLRVIVTTNLESGINLNACRMHTVAWGIPAALTIPPLVVNSFERLHTGWCWIESGHQILRLVSFYLPALLLLAHNLAVLAFVYWNVRHSKASESQVNKETADRVVQRLSLYLVVFVFIRFWGLANRINDAVNGDDHSLQFWTAAHAIAETLQGFGNAVVYGTSRSLLREYRAAFANLRRGGRVRVEGEA